MDDIEIIEEIENQIDLDEARKALTEYRANPSSAVSAEELYCRFGLSANNID